MGFFSKLLKVVGIAMAVLVPGAGQIWLALSAAFLVGGSVLDARAQSKKAKRAAAAALSDAQAQTVMVRQAIIPRRLIYGRTRVGGMWAYVDNSPNNKYMYLVLLLCDGPVKAIADIYFDDEIVALTETSGVWNGAGKWEDKVRIVKHLGAVDQAADTLLVSDSDEWTPDHRLLGVAYLSIRLEHDPNIFPQGLPNISAVVHGCNNVVDGRTDVAGYHTNPALCLAHYLSQTSIGPNVDWVNEINHTLFDTAATTCDELVDLEAAGNFTTSSGSDANEITATEAHGLYDSQIVVFTSTTALPAGLSSGTDYYVINSTKTTFEVSTSLDGDPVTITNDGTGTHSFTAKEHRYSFNGVVSLDRNPEDIMQMFKEAMAGSVVYIGGKWSFHAGEYQTPTFTIDEDILSGPIKFRPRRSKRDRYNAVKGFFMTHRNRWNPADYPPVTNSAYVAEDGEELIQGLDLSATATPQTAQRIAKIMLERGRMERVLELECNIEALRAEAGKTVLVNLPRYNINNEPYFVDSWMLEPKKDSLSVSLTLIQEDSTIYDWTSGTDEQVWSVADEPVLADGLPVAPENLILTNNAGGRDLVEVFMQWDATEDEFILQGGLVVIAWKKSADSEWQSITGDPSSVEYPVTGLEPDTNYDFRVAWRNKFGGQSDWTLEETHQTQSGSSSAYNYKHTQGMAATTWTIAHNLGYRPSVGAIFDHEGTPIMGGESTGTSGDPTGTIEIEIVFDSAIYGEAYLS